MPAAVHRTEEVIRRSRFITTLGHTPGPELAREFIDRVGAEFPDATHNCWAFVAGPPGSTAHVGMSDDGEPQGTAGRPMLTTLLHSDLGEIAAVVTRYYGGVKLGKGGLGRAYASGVHRALDTLPTVEKVFRVKCCLDFDYPSVDGVFRLLDRVEATRLEEEFGARVRLRVAVPLDRLTELERGLADETGGAGDITREDPDPEPWS
ncbi:MAG: YigZ family protein [Gemmatimonadales bacterium]|nr:MAG: YigZ family protein [Gemmatimonadales bacterium]